MKSMFFCDFFATIHKMRYKNSYSNVLNRMCEALSRDISDLLRYKSKIRECRCIHGSFVYTTRIHFLDFNRNKQIKLLIAQSILRAM